MPLVIQLFSLDKRLSPFAGIAKHMPPLHIVLVFLCSVSIHPYRPQNVVEHLTIFMSVVSGLGITYLIFVRKDRILEVLVAEPQKGIPIIHIYFKSTDSYSRQKFNTPIFQRIPHHSPCSKLFTLCTWCSIFVQMAKIVC